MADNTGIPLHKIKYAEIDNTKISREIAQQMEEKLGYNRLWVLTGEGPMKSGLKSTTEELKKDSPIFQTAETDNIKISEDLFLATRVLESGTAYATALHLNIRSFAKAVDAEERIANLETNQKEFEQRMQTEINNAVADLKNEMLTLKHEVNRLKATYENPDGSADCLTNTSGNE